MCGICGTLGFSDRHLLERMSAVITHRGPDEEGFYYDEKVGLGIRRLRIIDLEGGHDPRHSQVAQ